MHAKPDLRVVLKWMIYRSGSVIADVMSPYIKLTAVFMNRILVIGSGGSGKSILARELGVILGLPVIHLDSLYWKAGWNKPTKSEFDSKLEVALNGSRWIIDGNYTRTLGQRLAACDSVIFLDFPTWLCTYRLMRRMIKYRGTVRPDMANDCPERLDLGFMRWVWNYRNTTRPTVISMLSKLNGTHAVHRLHSKSEVDGFLRIMAT